MIVAIDHGYGYLHVLGVFDSVEEGQEIINRKYPEIAWEKPTDDPREMKSIPTEVMFGGKPTANARGEGTHLDEPYVSMYEVEQGKLYDFEWL